ncbi:MULTISPECIES: hypothetical protein [Dehalococcoides]|uniref:Uncharacterized protein n=1 Tax=Dehalococcoides mccartyi TaxID=61435 RepID=A0AB38Z8P2_9CHLR|nr:hypothetical protein [Dehalococcoides mccartyi]WRO06916.1 hypothetical protein VLL09_05880 [Dehalococcoides mccartyi]
MQESIKELCAKVVPCLDRCSNAEKKDAYTYLDLKISATPEGVSIKGYLDLNVLTTRQTWGYLPFEAYVSMR